MLLNYFYKGNFIFSFLWNIASSYSIALPLVSLTRISILRRQTIEMKPNMKKLTDLLINIFKFCFFQTLNSLGAIPKESLAISNLFYFLFFFH